MKNTILSLSLSFLCITMAEAQHQLKEIWRTQEEMPVPESVLAVPDKQLYVSLIDGGGMERDGKGGVALLNTDGTVKEKDWATGMNAPKGLGLYKNKLYVADIDHVVVVDAKSGKVLEKIEVPDATFLNDIAIDAKGTVYVSDTRLGKVFKLINHKPEVFLEDAESANGLLVVGDNLLVLAGPELWSVHAQTKEKQILAEGFEHGGDGIEAVGNGDYIVTCWPGVVYYVKADGNFEKLLDVEGEFNTADLGYDAKKKIVYIPTFNGNSVIAYQLQ
ncbi:MULTISPECIES: SMP-30/gluconolactonase/LRE family protein [unclassified Sphingobacterium]|uniref:SMP-30/gluconolactonase/LRE family protein n=1 Tax=unclassified Sphingobacterium TaxID=2609468 RepID=UPI0025DDE8D8|nr:MULTISPECIES: ATP-binding protein [unclassified Sphingobacterium]